VSTSAVTSYRHDDPARVHRGIVAEPGTYRVSDGSPVPFAEANRAP